MTKIQYKNLFVAGVARRADRRRGQTMMEYVVLVALLGVASIPIIKTLGDVFRDRVNLAANEIAGESGSSKSTEILDGSDRRVRRSMKDFYKR